MILFLNTTVQKYYINNLLKKIVHLLKMKQKKNKVSLQQMINGSFFHIDIQYRAQKHDIRTVVSLFQFAIILNQRYEIYGDILLNI